MLHNFKQLIIDNLTRYYFENVFFEKFHLSQKILLYLVLHNLINASQI